MNLTVIKTQKYNNKLDMKIFLNKINNKNEYHTLKVIKSYN